MKISRLRLLGFKSFVEPTDLVIERGLTGVVGPNGCGKSNLLEALRWVMGETSHKSMRAAAMDDVIFSGTNLRPARNFAEVTMFLDNQERQAPAEFNDHDVIEITRRIEREAGSAYRINGKDSRARDVKILFEDAATGARSPALVRQGQISEIVNAKPEQRRRILEDAAGVAGLHSRRHEAELRLTAAENNLGRLTDIMGQLVSQIESLKRQARQARRYKEISGEIRRIEALWHYLLWADAQALVTGEERSLTDVLGKLGQATEAEARALRQEAEFAEALPPLREEEARRGAALGRLKIEQENFEREATRAMDRQRELQSRAEHLTQDISREERLIGEARELLQSAGAELASLDAAEAGADEAQDAARATVDNAGVAQKTAEADLVALTNRTAEFRAQRQSLEAQGRERREGVSKIERQLMALGQQLRETAARAPDVQKLTATADAGQKLSRDIAEIEQLAEAAEEKVRELTATVTVKREQANRARLRASELKTERETLAKLLVAENAEGLPPIAEGLRVALGYEAALGAALGDDLEAPISDDAAVHWRLIEPASADGALPADVEPLSNYVKAPPELQRRLRQIGIVDREDGARLQPHLRPGQRLVSREGDLWRWDGFAAAAHGVTPAAQRIAERNRLSDLAAREKQAAEEADLLSDAEAHAAEQMQAAGAADKQLRSLWRETQVKLTATRDELTKIERAARETETRIASLNEAKAVAEDELIDANGRFEEIDTALSLLSEADDLEPQLAAAQDTATAARNAHAEAKTQLAALERDRALRAERVRTLTAERDRWATRSSGAEQQIATLRERLDGALDELEGMADLPALIDEKRHKLLASLEGAERERRTVADELAQADTALRAAQQALRIAQGQVGEAREGKARIEAKLESARGRRQEEARKIRETFEVAPEDCLSLAELKPGTAPPHLGDVDKQLTRLKGDRERLGGVNLQADEELTVLQAQHDTMETERADVDEAIAKLRGAIGQLNKEGKKRLNDAFETVNGHFGRLFTSLFGGGEARLEMVESEDPMEGGLEIIAKPPGKKPATLSLLSGGEQTLTALSLIFAVFLTNPSPICVLDEVDAPLDDANVDRFCKLMEKMAEETDTRFLVITHHPMTMTHMDRLFGVTMAERGISQLVSVDLQTAQSFREAG
ncbi:MAG: chromosome segregation protein SMC [Hyphomicrobiaceae bacterium]|nr:chromosome segregation protein SMC [Hyphomicrobiaceae bacterium]